MLMTQTPGPTLLEQLKEAVERSPKSKGKLAEEAGITRKTLFNILEGGQDFRVSSLLALADVLKLDVALAPQEVRELRLSQPGTDALSSHSRVAQFMASTKKDEKWK